MSELIKEEIKMSYGEPPYDIHIEVRSAGDDVFAIVTGGTRPHIGAIALAEPSGVSILQASGHKDAVIAEMFAKGLHEKCGVNVCVSAGVHVDDATSEEIALLIANAKSLLTYVCEAAGRPSCP